METNEDQGPIIFHDLVQSHLPNLEPNIIFEIGAMDGRDSVRLANLFPKATIYAFEPNPATWDLVVRNTLGHPRIKPISMVVSEQEGFIKFYQSETQNQGCSSIYRSSGKYDIIEPLPQREISVASTRLDSFMQRFNLDKIDAFWLDAQGAELSILKSLGTKLSTVCAIWSEFFYDEVYFGQVMLPELSAFLTENGFTLLWKRDVAKDITGKWWWGDVFFARL